MITTFRLFCKKGEWVYAYTDMAGKYGILEFKKCSEEPGQPAIWKYSLNGEDIDWAYTLGEAKADCLNILEGFA